MGVVQYTGMMLLLVMIMLLLMLAKPRPDHGHPRATQYNQPSINPVSVKHSLCQSRACWHSAKPDAGCHIFVFFFVEKTYSVLKTYEQSQQ